MRALRGPAVIVGAALLLAGAGAGGAVAVGRLTGTTPPVTPAVKAASTWIPVPGTPPAIPEPPRGSLAVDAVVGATATSLLASDASTVRPIASVTKTMTALVVLELHPLPPGEQGPVLTMSARDVADYVGIAAAGGSVAPVILGERLTERDLLLGLMLPSANNMALTLARWVDGTVGAFVARLNARAAALGMAHTHFADPDGLDPATTSTAADLVVLGERAVADDALVAIVSTAAARLPDGTVVDNLDSLLGSEPGWLGIKTGWTGAAGGCLLFAARLTLAPGAPPLTIVGAVLGQGRDAAADPRHPELGAAFATARTAVERAFAGYSVVRVRASAIPVSGTVRGPWGDSASLDLAGPDQALLLRLGDALTISANVNPVAVPSRAGAVAGSVALALRHAVVGRWTLALRGPLVTPSAWWRLLHG